MKKILPLAILLLAVAPAAVFAAGGEGEGKDIMEIMTRFVLQLGIIVIIARTAGLVMKRVRLPVPSVLVELLIGVAIGPYLLGGVPLPGFPEGVFPLSTATAIPISPELYGIATVASIIMLFSAGLETDLPLLLRFSLLGLLVGAGGVVAAFFAGAGITMFFYPELPFSDPKVLLMGMVGISSSMGITARILSERRKMDAPEGVTVLAASVIEDVLCIIVLTVVTSYIALSSGGGAAASAGEAKGAVVVVVRAIVVWLAFTAAGIIFARQLSKVIKAFKSVAGISIFALGLALILAGIFEMAGLAMIIGAYVVGLSLSKTDLADTVRDSLEVMYGFFVPFFFIVMGMLVDVHVLMSKEVLIFGVAYSLVVAFGKMAGCGLPTMFLNFNKFGALRVAMGLTPRGELAIIIAGIGLSAGMLDHRFFGVAILMVLLNDIWSPSALSAVFKSGRKGTKKDFAARQTVSTTVKLASRKLVGILEELVVQAFRSDGFFVYSITIDSHNVYHLRENDIHIVLHVYDDRLLFQSDAQDVTLIRTVAYEALLQVNDIIVSAKGLIRPDDILKGVTTTDADDDHGGIVNGPGNTGDANGADCCRDGTSNNACCIKRRMEAGEFRLALTQGSIIPTLTATTKREVVEKLVGILRSEGLLKRCEDAVNAVMEREASMSTGMQHGVALPHARTDAVEKITIAVGLCPNGIDFESIDGEPSKIFVLILSPLSGDCPYIRFLASVSGLLNEPEAREKLMRCRTQGEIYGFFREGLGG